MSEWEEVKLGDVLLQIIGGGTPSKSRADYWDGDISWASVKDLVDGRYRISTTKDKITHSGLLNSASNLIPAGTIITATRITLGRTVISDIDVAINQDLKALIPTEKIYNGFLLWLMIYLSPQIDMLGTGTTVKGIRLETLREIPILLPPLPEQRAIAQMLGSLDDKIEANRRENETLEATARAIFKSWFVDFDPVHAKSRGEIPAGMDEETARLFPDAFVESELGRIPRGWRVEAIGKHVKASKGLSYKGDYLVDSIEDGIPMHNLNSIAGNGGYQFDGIKFYSGEYGSKHIVNSGDLIVANTDLTLDLLVIASPAIVPSVYGNKGIISHHIYKVEIKSSSPLTRLFLYYQIMMRPFRDVLQGYTNGTTVNMLPSDAFEKPLFIMPTSEMMRRFDAIVAPMLEKIEQNYIEAKTLAETRDALLPKLMSGEVRVGDTTRDSNASIL